jgi:hypothetical protein
MMQASEAAGLNAMAQALVASGHLTQEAAGQMLASEYAAGGYAPASGTGPSAQAPAFPAGGAAPLPAASAPFLAHDPAPRAPGSPPQANAQAGAAPAEAAHARAGSADQVDPAPGSALGDAFDPALAELQALPIDPLFAPPQTPDGYALELDPRVKMDPQDISAVRAWFHTMRLPQPIAQSIYSETERMHRAGAPSAAQIDRLTAQTRATLARAWGERTDAMLASARRLIDTAARAHPGLKAALARGPGSNPVIVRQLAEHAQRLYGGAAGHDAAPNATAHKGD